MPRNELIRVTQDFRVKTQRDVIPARQGGWGRPE